MDKKIAHQQKTRYVTQKVSRTRLVVPLIKAKVKNHLQFLFGDNWHDCGEDVTSFDVRFLGTVFSGYIWILLHYFLSGVTVHGLILKGTF